MDNKESCPEITCYILSEKCIGQMEDGTCEGAEDKHPPRYCDKDIISICDCEAYRFQYLCRTNNTYFCDKDNFCDCSNQRGKCNTSHVCVSGRCIPGKNMLHP